MIGMCIRWLKSCSRDISSITHKVLDSVFYSSCLHFYRLNPYLVHLVLGYKFFLRHLFLMIQLDSFSRFHSIFFHSCSCSKTIQKKNDSVPGINSNSLEMCCGYSGSTIARFVFFKCIYRTHPNINIICSLIGSRGIFHYISLLHFWYCCSVRNNLIIFCLFVYIRTTNEHLWLVSCLHI